MPPKKKQIDAYTVTLAVELRKREKGYDGIGYIGILEEDEIKIVMKRLKKKPKDVSNVWAARDEFFNYEMIYTIPKKTGITVESIKENILIPFTDNIGLIEVEDKTIFAFIHNATILYQGNILTTYTPEDPLEKYELKEEIAATMPPKRNGTVVLEVDIVEVLELDKGRLPLFKKLSKKLSTTEVEKITKAISSKTNAAKSVVVTHNKKDDTFELTYEIEANPGSTFNELKNLLFEIIGDVRLGWRNVKGDNRILGYSYREKGTPKVSLNEINKEREKFNNMRTNITKQEQTKKTNKTATPVRVSPSKTTLKSTSPVKEMPPKRGAKKTSVKKSSPARTSPAKSSPAKKGRGRPKKSANRTTPKKNQKVAKSSPAKKTSPVKSQQHKFAKVALEVVQKKGGKKANKKQLEGLFESINSPIKIGKNEVFVHKVKVSKDGRLTVKFMVHDKVTPEKVGEYLQKYINKEHKAKFEVMEFETTELGAKKSNKGKTLSAIKNKSTTRSRSATRSRSRSATRSRSRSASKSRSASRSRSVSPTKSASPAKKGRGRPKKTSPNKKSSPIRKTSAKKKGAAKKSASKERSPATTKLIQMLDDEKQVAKDKSLQKIMYKVLGLGKKNLTTADKNKIIDAIVEISDEPESKIGHITDNFVYADSIVLFNKTTKKNAEKFAKNIEKSFNNKEIEASNGKTLTLKLL